MDYSKFGVEDFLCDTSFLEYCIGTNEEAVVFWTAWLAKHPEKLKAANSARSLYYALNGNIDAESFHKDFEAFKNAFSGTLPLPVEPAKVIRIRKNNNSLVFTLTGVAACMLVAFGLFLFKKSKTNQATSVTDLSYNTSLGKKLTLKLTDGSVVTLNSGSSLVVSKDFNVHKRDVTLIGEGYFVVAHNAAKPFMVHTQKINVKDIGTEFNIKAYSADKTTEASLIKGRIEITLNNVTTKHFNQSAIVLSPNNKFIIDNNVTDLTGEQKSVKQPFAISHITTNTSTNSVVETDWKENKLTFYDSSLDDIALQMERWYGVKIQITNPAIKAYRFTATFDHEDIIQVLDALKLSSNFNYRKEDNVISIY